MAETWTPNLRTLPDEPALQGGVKQTASIKTQRLKQPNSHTIFFINDTLWFHHVMTGQLPAQHFFLPPLNQQIYYT
jgi:hypothetical protein